MSNGLATAGLHSSLRRAAAKALAATDQYNEFPPAPHGISDAGRAASLHPFRNGQYLGSGPAAFVLAQAGLDPQSQVEAVRAYAGGTVPAAG